jgi:DNA-binding GntR family transcriptional regulator
MKKSSKSVEVVIEELKTGIRNGRYVPGQRLITSDVAEKLGTSLAPVREAIHMLAGEGLIELIPNRGASVRQLTPRDLVDGVQALEVVGALALRLIAPRLAEPKVSSEIAEALAPIYDAGRRRDRDAFFSAIAKSHRLVNQYSGNSFLNPILNRLHLEYFYRQMADLLPSDFYEQYTLNYEATGEKLVEGDAKTAERNWVKHCRWLIRLLSKHLD